MKKIIAIALALVMCLGIMSMVAFAAGDKMTVKVVAPAEWEECYVYSWNPESFGGWPGTKIDGSFELTGAVEGMVIGAGNGKPQTVDIKDLTFAAGTEATITVGETGADGKHTYTITNGTPNTNGTTSATQATTTATQATTTATQATTAATVTSGTRTLTVKVPSSWKEVHVYTWEPNDLGDWPGSKLTKASDDTYKTNIKNSMIHLIVASEQQADTTYKQTGDITLETNGKAVTVTVNDDCSYKVEYAGGSSSNGTRKPAAADPVGTPSNYRVVGNADWMGSWKEDNDKGIMIDIGGGVYRKNFDNVAPGSYELKITKDGKWDNAIGDENGQNFKFTVDQKCKITVDFTIKDGKGVISVYGSGVPALGDVSMISVVILMGLASVTAIVLVVNKKKFI